MRINNPVTQREFEFGHDVTLMSTTDTQSHVTYANAAFLRVSGFEYDEIMGQPHNLVRHPDMPSEAFADMWATLKAGKSWTALVKNRRKNGDHYWVRANATPMIRNGSLSGYMSVRTQPTRDEVAMADALYKRLREGRARGFRFHQGLVVGAGWLAWISVFQRLSVGGRIRLGLAGSWFGFLASAALLGAGALVAAKAAAVSLVLLLVTDRYLHAQVTRPLQLIERQAQNVASGSPSENINLNRVDEIGMIMRSVNQAGLNLRSLVDDVGAQVDGLHTACEQIAQGSHDLSVRTEQSAASLQETAASMEQFAEKVRHNADSARQASEIAAQASEAAVKGGDTVGQVVGTMDDITASSRKIADIITVIDGIAFQTNILALNAAVEAARAGEQGRGFAVVAGEVRSLAQRSAEAAREIKQLIGASVERVEVGAGQVAQAGERMADIVGQVRRVTDLIGEITASSHEQASSAAQVSQAVATLDGATQQNAALVEESVAVANSSRAQVERLAEALAVYGKQTVRVSASPQSSVANARVRRLTHA